MNLILKKNHYAWVFRGKFSRNLVGVGRLMCCHDKCLGSPNSVHSIVIWGGTAECKTCTCSENLPHRWTRRGDTVNEAGWFSYLVLTYIEFGAFFLYHSNTTRHHLSTKVLFRTWRGCPSFLMTSYLRDLLFISWMIPNWCSLCVSRGLVVLQESQVLRVIWDLQEFQVFKVRQ